MMTLSKDAKKLKVFLEENSRLKEVLFLLNILKLKL
jgi:hypothetical protein